MVLTGREVRPIVLMLCLVAAGLGGCARTPRGEPFQPAMVEADKAVIYVFRPSSRRKTAAQVFINQEEAGTLGSGQYLSRVVEPGEHFVRVEAGSSMVRVADVVAGDVVYLMVVMGRKSKPVLETPEPDLARRLIAGTKQVSPPPVARATNP